MMTIVAKYYTDLDMTVEAKPGDRVAVINQDEALALIQVNPEHRPVFCNYQNENLAKR